MNPNELAVSAALSKHFGSKVEVIEGNDGEGIFYKTAVGNLRYAVYPQWENINDIAFGPVKVLARIP